MGAVVSDSAMGGARFAEQNVRRDRAPAAFDDAQLRALAQTILDQEPAEIRVIVRNEPAVVRAWIDLMKDKQLQTSGSASVWHEALDHIRLSTLSPLKFAAE